MTADITFNRIPAETLARWKTVRDVVAGDQAMRTGGYLPVLNKADDSPENRERNAAYVQRAVFYGATGRTLDGLLGIAFKKDPSHALPDSLNYLLTDADGGGTSVYQQSQATVSNLLQVGRHGLLVDFDERLQRPVIKSYAAESIINWHIEGGVLQWIVLQEVVDIRDGYGLETAVQYRELFLEDGKCTCRVWQEGNGGVALLQTIDANGQPTTEVVLRSQTQVLDFIPFRFVGSRNNDANIDDSPLYALAQVNVAHFRNSADYEDSVFFSGQAQPWISGLSEEWRDHLEAQKSLYIGSRSPLLLPEGGAFGFSQPQPNTLVFEAMEQKEKQMVALGARLLDQNAVQVTATQSDNDREASTSVLSMCVANTSEAYQTAIGWCAMLLGKSLSQDQIQGLYKINQDYSRVAIDAQAVAAMISAWQTGVIAKPDLRAYLRSEGVLAVERTDQEIDDDLEAQGPALGTVGAD